MGPTDKNSRLQSMDWGGVKARLREMRGSASQASLAETLGYRQSDISEWESTDRKPPIEFMAALAHTAGRSLEWVLFGQAERPPTLTEKTLQAFHQVVDRFFASARLGDATDLDEIEVRLPPDDRLQELEKQTWGVPIEMTPAIEGETEAPGPSLHTGRAMRHKLLHHHPDAFVALKLLSDKAAAGEPRVVDERDVEDYIIMYRDWVPHPGDTTCIRITGDSMHPVVPDGSLVAIDHAERDPHALEGKIVAALVDDGVTVKWLRVSENGLVLLSENTDYDPIVLQPSGADVNPIIGKVIWSLNRWF